MDQTAGIPQEYAILTQQILSDKQLTLADKLVLARISGFEKYWESLDSCAQFLDLCPTQVSVSRNKLEELGYIKCIENNGRGKVYIFLLNRVTQKPSQSWSKTKSELVDDQTYNKYNNKKDNTPYSPPQAGDKEPTKNSKVDSTEPEKENSAKTVKVVASKPSTRRISKKSFEKLYPDLVEVRDRAFNHLMVGEIPVPDIKELNRGIIAIAKLYRSPKFPRQHIKVLNEYINFLESDEYWYQVEHNKFCPRITSVADFANKFNQIKTFKNNPAQWYDPSKVLTKD